MVNIIIKKSVSPKSLNQKEELKSLNKTNKVKVNVGSSTVMSSSIRPQVKTAVKSSINTTKTAKTDNDFMVFRDLNNKAVRQSKQLSEQSKLKDNVNQKQTSVHSKGDILNTNHSTSISKDILHPKTIVKELGYIIKGDITSDSKSTEYFSTDGSIFKIKPTIVMYPKNEMDVVKAVSYVASKALNGQIIPITARGKGTDQGGGALSEGMLMVFPGYMDQVLALGKNSITMQPGTNYQVLQNVLYAHNRFLPPYPASFRYSTIGGAIGNDSAGEKTAKYGTTRDYVIAMRSVLSNGDIITTHRLDKKGLKRKMAQNNFEGHIYRGINQLIEDNKELILATQPLVSKNSAGYALWDVKKKDGSFDLGKLLVGSQSTLAITTEATLEHVEFNPNTKLIVAFFDDNQKMTKAVADIMPLRPSAVEIVDYHLLDMIDDHYPNQLEAIVQKQMDGQNPRSVLLIEFDDNKSRTQNRKAHMASKIIRQKAYSWQTVDDLDEQDQYWKIRRGAAATIWMMDSSSKALPIIEDAIVPLKHMPTFLQEVYKLFKARGIRHAMWGHGGDANFHIQPFFDLSKEEDRKMIYDLQDDFYKIVFKYGGSTCGEHNDGILRGKYLPGMYGSEMVKVFKEVKRLFDPLNILNPLSKIGSIDLDSRQFLRREYSMPHLLDYMPHFGRH